MKPIQHGVSIVWGLEMPLPKLPEGFTVTRRTMSHAIARGPKGRKAYLIARIPDRLVPILSREGNTTTADFENPIPL